MANLIYTKAKEAFLSAGINLATDTIKAALVSSGYTYVSTHQFYSDLTPGSNVVGTPVTLTSTTVTNGVFNAAGVAFTGLSATATVNYVAIYKDTGTAGTSPLIALFDTGTGLPISLTTSVTEVDITWDPTAKIFSI